MFLIVSACACLPGEGHLICPLGIKLDMLKDLEQHWGYDNFIKDSQKDFLYHYQNQNIIAIVRINTVLVARIWENLQVLQGNLYDQLSCQDFMFSWPLKEHTE